MASGCAPAQIPAPCIELLLVDLSTGVALAEDIERAVRALISSFPDEPPDTEDQASDHQPPEHQHHEHHHGSSGAPHPPPGSIPGPQSHRRSCAKAGTGMRAIVRKLSIMIQSRIVRVLLVPTPGMTGVRTAARRAVRSSSAPAAPAGNRSASRRTPCAARPPAPRPGA